MEQEQQAVKQQSLVAKRGRAQLDMDERFGDAFGDTKHTSISRKLPRRH